MNLRGRGLMLPLLAALLCAGLVIGLLVSRPLKAPEPEPAIAEVDAAQLLRPYTTSDYTFAVRNHTINRDPTRWLAPEALHHALPARPNDMMTAASEADLALIRALITGLTETEATEAEPVPPGTASPAEVVVFRTADQAEVFAFGVYPGSVQFGLPIDGTLYSIVAAADEAATQYLIAAVSGK